MARGVRTRARKFNAGGAPIGEDGAVDAPPGSPPRLAAYTAEERPDLFEQARTDGRFRALWPEYNHHGQNVRRTFAAVYPDFARLQVLFVDRRSGDLVARSRTIPFRWDGTRSDLPAGFDALGRRALDEPGAPTALSAPAAEVVGDHQGEVG